MCGSQFACVAFVFDVYENRTSTKGIAFLQHDSCVVFQNACAESAVSLTDTDSYFSCTAFVIG